MRYISPRRMGIDLTSKFFQESGFDDQECKMADLVLCGRRNKEISDELGVSFQDIGLRLSNIREKVGIFEGRAKGFSLPRTFLNVALKKGIGGFIHTDRVDAVRDDMNLTAKRVMLGIANGLTNAELLNATINGYQLDKILRDSESLLGGLSAEHTALITVMSQAVIDGGSHEKFPNVHAKVSDFS